MKYHKLQFTRILSYLKISLILGIQKIKNNIFLK